MFQKDDIKSKIIKHHVTLEDAQEHCSDDETSSSTCTTTDGLKLTIKSGQWFDGYEEIKEEQ